MPDAEAEIRGVLERYEAALNASDTAVVMTLYAEGGVFMPPFSPTAVGPAALRAAYDAVFAAIELEVAFAVQEIVVTAPDWAFARTNSSGHVRVHASGERRNEANQELFVFRREPVGWRIARYAFSTTNPPAMP